IGIDLVADDRIGDAVDPPLEALDDQSVRRPVTPECADDQVAIGRSVVHLARAKQGHCTHVGWTASREFRLHGNPAPHPWPLSPRCGVRGTGNWLSHTPVKIRIPATIAIRRISSPSRNAARNSVSTGCT